MKNKYQLAVLLSAICFTGCQQEDIVYPGENVEMAATYLTLDELTQSPVVVKGPEGTYVLKVQSDDKWEVTSSQSWCTIAEKEGFKYSQVPVSFSENPWNESRSAELTFTIKETQKIKIVTLVQEASITSLLTDIQDLQYNIGGGEKSIVLQTNAIEWHAKIVEEGTETPPSWCTVDIESGRGKTTLKVKTLSNPSETVRKASLVFTAEDKSLSIPIVQADKLVAPIIKMDDSDKLLISWDKLAGVDGYNLKVKMNQEAITVNIPSGATSYDLNNIDWQGYVGMISIQLFSYADLGSGTMTQMGSEILSAHNLFDETSGNGEENSEYIITKPRHLKNVGKYLDKHYKQKADIDLTDVTFEPISGSSTADTYTGAFTGVFDASKGTIVDAATKRSSEQYKIKNWTLNKGTYSNCGLFAMIGAGGIVRNVCIENPVISAKAKAGSIAGASSGRIISCHVTGTRGKLSTAATAENEIYLGGIVGYLTEGGVVSYCTNAVKIEGSAGCVGGIAGVIMRDANNAPSILYCTNKADIVSNLKSPLGGVIGSIAGAVGTGKVTINGCVNTGNVSGTQANNQVAGIAGRATVDTEIAQSYNTGSITANGSAAGIIGRMGGNAGIIKDCYNTGAIKSLGTVVNGNSNAAGILATCTVAAGGTMTVENCHNTGSTAGPGVAFISGVFNRTDAKIAKIAMKNCFALNESGKMQGAESDSFITGGSASYKNLSAGDMKNTSLFTGWDFSSVWKMGSEYPILQGIAE